MKPTTEKDEKLAIKCCQDKLGRNCSCCPYNHHRNINGDKCYKIWNKHNPNSKNYKGE